MKTIINTENAPEPVGPYNQAIAANGFLFVSGQVALNPQTKELVTHDIKAETQQVMTNLTAILHKAGITFKEVVKATIFLSDMANYKAVNEVYAEYFDSENAPAREAVAVKELPLGVNIEISVIALLPSA